VFRTELTDLFVDLVPDLARLLEFSFRRAAEFRRIRKGPVQAPGYAGKDWTSSRFGFIANRDHVGEQLPGFKNVEHRPRFVLGNIDPDFAKHFYCERIQFTGFESGAFRFEKFPAAFVEQRRCHLTARAIVHADKQHFLFHIKAGSRGAIWPVRRTGKAG